MVLGTTRALLELNFILHKPQRPSAEFGAKIAAVVKPNERIAVGGEAETTSTLIGTRKVFNAHK